MHTFLPLISCPGGSAERGGKTTWGRCRVRRSMTQQ